MVQSLENDNRCLDHASIYIYKYISLDVLSGRKITGMSTMEFIVEIVY